MIDDQFLQVCFIGVLASIIQKTNERLNTTYTELTGQEFVYIKDDDPIIEELTKNINSLEKLKEATIIAKRALSRMQSSLEML